MSSPFTLRPEPGDYPPAVAHYLTLVPDGDLLAILTAQSKEMLELLEVLHEDQALIRHAPYKWTIKQVVGHMSDCDRVFGYRALRLARNDATPLPAFDENAYMENASFDVAPLGELLGEFDHLRRSHVLMLRQLEPDAWQRRAMVNNFPTTVRAIACVMAGHTQHHLNILHKRLES